MKIIVFGGDGFCGWPTALYLSNQGHDITIVDNLSRRRIDTDLGIESLTPIGSIQTRIEAWREVSQRTINYFNIDVAVEYDALCSLLTDINCDALIHYAEQRAAPYSMKGPSEKRYTVSNNINATHNILCALVDTQCDAHVVHLGTMGVYGYNSTETALPEGYLNIEVGTDSKGNQLSRDILYPVDPGSIYHLTKCQDQLLFYYYNKNDNLRITDLHQGIVWGTATDESILDDRLINRFDYDGDYGTVLNRFLMQAAIGHPLTVHGTGRQTRAFIHIRDTLRCVEIALNNPPDFGNRVQVFNQFTEVYSVVELAHLVSKLTGSDFVHVDNPRNEAANNELLANPDTLISLGLKPTLLHNALLEEVVDTARKFEHRCDRPKIVATSRWTKTKH